MKNQAVVLVVDDEPTALGSIQAMLEGETFQIQTASNGQEALAMAEQFRPDVIILDIMMPEMDGFEVCRRLKTNRELSPIPIILLTTLREKTHLVRGLDAGADEFISKPVECAELRARVRTMWRIKQQHDQLRSTMQLREDLAHMVAHDMRNHLGTVLSYGELLGLQAELGEESRQMTADLKANAWKLKRFIDDYLVQAKMEEGRIRLQRSTVDLVKLMAKVKDNHTIIAQSKHIFIQVIFELGKKPRQPLEVDADLMERLLDNLLNNAIKYSPAGSSIRVQIDYPAASEAPAQPAPLVRIRFADQGVGVMPEDRERIFDKFEIVALKQTKGAQVGLGLAFCKLVAEAHGGRIYVEPNQPQGSVFVVEM